MDANSDGQHQVEIETPKVPSEIILETAEKFRPLHANVSSCWQSALREIQLSFRETASSEEKLKCVLTHSVVPEWPPRPDGPYPSAVEGMEPIAMGVAPSRWPQQLFLVRKDHTEPFVSELAPNAPQSYRLKMLDVASKMQLDGVVYQPIVGDCAIQNVTGNPILFSNGEPVALRLGANRNYFVHAGGAMHQRIKNITSFFSSAAKAGQVIEELPHSVNRVLWSEWLDGFRTLGDKGMWISALFELAWKQASDSVLTAERFTWSETENIPFELPPSSRHKKVGFAEEMEVGPDAPAHWYAVIEDLVSASINAIDILITMDNGEDTTCSGMEEGESSI